MPDKDNFGAVLQPIGATDVSDSLVARNNQTTGFHTDVVATPIAYRWQNNRDGLQQDDAVAAMRASTGSSGFHEMNHPVVVAHAFYSTGGTHGVNQHPEVSPAVKVGSGLGIPSPPAVVIGTDCYNGPITGDVAATMGTPGSSVNASGPTVMQAMAFDWQKGNDIHNPRPSTMNVQHECTPTIGTTRTPAVAHALRADGFDASEDGTGRGTPLVPVAPSLTATNDPSRSPQSSEVTQQVAAVYASTMTVRRLTPRECERLQGFPDDWTLIPWRKKQAEDCPDGPRYRALGNSMAVNCMSWIGERIAKWEAEHER
jgi:hypothetical protein